MAAKMSLCTISYNYEHYAGIDVEKLSNIIYEYVKKPSTFRMIVKWVD